VQLAEFLSSEGYVAHVLYLLRGKQSTQLFSVILTLFGFI